MIVETYIRANSPHSLYHCFLISVLVSLSVLAAFSVCRAENDSTNRISSPDLTELNVEELMSLDVATVYGASRYEQKVTEAPASVSLVTADEIKKYGYRTLADVLRSFRGVYVTYDRNYNYIGVRGFDRPGDLNTRVLLLVDGHRINDNVFESAPIGTEFPVDLDLINRIEFIRGPSSSLYGTNAFFGVINIITRKGAELQGVEFSGSAGSFDTYTGRLSYGREFRSGLDVLFSASVMNSNGPERLFYREFNAPDTNNGIAAHTDDDKNYQFFTRLALRDFTFTGSYVSREKGIPTASFGTVFNDPHNRTTDEHGFLDLKYTHSFEDRTEVTARTYFDRFYYRGDYLYDRANQGDPPLTVLDKDLARSYRWGGELQATKTLFGRHKVTSGMEFRDNIRQDQSNYDENPYLRYLDDRRRSSNWALFLQDEIRLLDSLIFTAGVRYDHYDTVGGTTNPRLALIYKPLEGTVFKLLYGEAFRAPGPFEIYYDDGQTVKSNPQLKPEKIRTYELVYEQYFLEHFRSSLSGFYYRINDLISQQEISPGLFQFNNIDKVDARGVELELEGRYDNGLKGRISYTYQDTRNLNAGSSLTNSPRHLAKLNLILPLFRDKVFAGIEEQYTGSRMTLAGRQAAPFCVTNLTLFSQSLLPGLDLSVSIYNLFDKHYDDPGAAEHRQDVIEQDGRTFRVKLTYLF